MSSYILKDTNRDTEREFDTEEKAVEKKDDMVGLGAKPEDLEIIEQDETSDTSDVEVVDHSPGTSTKSEDTELPDRDLTNDPISWLQQGSDEFVTTIKGTPVIKKKGFRVLQHKYNISTQSIVKLPPEETDMEYCRVKATAEMPDGRIAEAHGSAHVSRGDDPELLLEMADTRAKSRALSDITGVGAVAAEEMHGVGNDE